MFRWNKLLKILNFLSPCCFSRNVCFIDLSTINCRDIVKRKTLLEGNEMTSDQILKWSFDTVWKNNSRFCRFRNTSGNFNCFVVGFPRCLSSLKICYLLLKQNFIFYVFTNWRWNLFQSINFMVIHFRRCKDSIGEFHFHIKTF